MGEISKRSTEKQYCYVSEDITNESTDGYRINHFVFCGFTGALTEISLKIKILCKVATKLWSFT